MIRRGRHRRAPAVGAALRGGVVRGVRLLILLALITALTLMVLNIETRDYGSAIFFGVAAVVITVFLAQTLTRR